jgi:glycosyltransferase involved in cell wall biosynthesis
MPKKPQIRKMILEKQLTDSLQESEIILAMIPCPYFGSTGSSVNERQLLEALSRKVSKVIVFSLTPISQMSIGKKNIEKPSNILLISLPLITRLGVLCQALYSPILLLLTLLLDSVYKVEFIYVRMSLLAFTFTMFKRLRDKLIVKIPALFEDEIKSKTPSKRLICLLVSLFDKVVLKNAALIASPSTLLIRKIIVKRCIPRGRIIIVPPGVDLEKINRVKNEIKFMKKEEFIVGFLGLFSSWQGIDILVESVAKLKDAGLDKPVKLLLVGDGPERRRIEDLCKKLEIDYEITGFVKHEKALEYLSMFDVLVLPSYRISTTESNIPIKVIEAWALGIPVITTRHEIYEYMKLKNWEDVIYCEPDPEDVANKILMVLRDENLKKRLSEKGLLLANNFYYNNIALRLVEAFMKSL